MIPAVPEHMDTWTDVFGFQRLEESDKQELKCLNMLVFPRTDMLKKTLPRVNTDSGSQDNATAETLPISSPSEPKLTGSHLEPDAEGTTPSEPKLTGSHSEPDTDESTPSEPKVTGSGLLLEPNVDETTTSEPKLTVSHSEPDAVEGTPSEPKLNGSHSEPDADESTPSEPKLTSSHSEPDADASTHSGPKLTASHSELDRNESTIQVASGFPSVISSEPEIQVHSNVNLEETDLQNIDETDAPKLPCNNSVSSYAHGESVPLKGKELTGSDVETDLSVKPSDAESCL